MHRYGEGQAGVREAIGRRRYLTAFGVLLTALLCFLASVLVPASYKVTARVLVFPHSESQTPATNPYSSLNGLDPAASVLAEAATSAESSRDLKRQGATGTFTVAPDESIQGPVLLIDVRDTTASGALSTLSLVVSALPTRLKNLQSQVGVPAGLLLSSTVISRDSRVTVVRKSQVRAVLVAGVGGIAGTLLCIAMIDGLLLRRRSPASGAARRGDLTDPQAPWGVGSRVPSGRA